MTFDSTVAMYLIVNATRIPPGPAPCHGSVACFELWCRGFHLVLQRAQGHGAVGRVMGAYRKDTIIEHPSLHVQECV